MQIPTSPATAEPLSSAEGAEPVGVMLTTELAPPPSECVIVTGDIVSDVTDEMRQVMNHNFDTMIADHVTRRGPG